MEANALYVNRKTEVPPLADLRKRSLSPPSLPGMFTIRNVVAAS